MRRYRDEASIRDCPAFGLWQHRCLCHQGSRRSTPRRDWTFLVLVRRPLPRPTFAPAVASQIVPASPVSASFDLEGDIPRAPLVQEPNLHFIRLRARRTSKEVQDMIRIMDSGVGRHGKVSREAVEQIVMSAMALLAYGLPDGTRVTTAHICDAAGVSSSTYWRAFPDKQGLVDTVYATAWERVEEIYQRGPCNASLPSSPNAVKRILADFSDLATAWGESWMPSETCQGDSPWAPLEFHASPPSDGRDMTAIYQYARECISYIAFTERRSAMVSESADQSWRNTFYGRMSSNLHQAITERNLTRSHDELMTALMRQFFLNIVLWVDDPRSYCTELSPATLQAKLDEILTPDSGGNSGVADNGPHSGDRLRVRTTQIPESA